MADGAPAAALATSGELVRAMTKKAARRALVGSSRQRQIMCDLLRTLHSRGMRDGRLTKLAAQQLQHDQLEDTQ